MYVYAEIDHGTLWVFLCTLEAHHLTCLFISVVTGSLEKSGVRDKWEEFATSNWQFRELYYNMSHFVGIKGYSPHWSRTGGLHWRSRASLLKCPQFTITVTFGLGRKCWSSYWCYLCHFHIILENCTTCFLVLGLTFSFANCCGHLITCDINLHFEMVKNVHWENSSVILRKCNGITFI